MLHSDSLRKKLFDIFISNFFMKASAAEFIIRNKGSSLVLKKRRRALLIIGTDLFLTRISSNAHRNGKVRQRIPIADIKTANVLPDSSGFILQIIYGNDKLSLLTDFEEHANYWRDALQKNDRVEELTDVTEHESDTSTVLPDYIKAQTERMIEQYSTLLNSPDWKRTSLKSGVQGYCRVVDGITLAKGVGIAPYSAARVTEFLCSKKAETMDKAVDYRREIQIFDKWTCVDYSAYKPVRPTAPRDFVNLMHTHHNVDANATYILVQAIERNDCPEKPEFVRGKVLIAGWKIEALGETSSRISHIVHCDINGSVPKWLLSRAMSQQAFLVNDAITAIGKDVVPAIGNDLTTAIGNDVISTSKSCTKLSAVQGNLPLKKEAPSSANPSDSIQLVFGVLVFQLAIYFFNPPYSQLISILLPWSLFLSKYSNTGDCGEPKSEVEMARAELI